jgi:general stress protein CsbA
MESAGSSPLSDLSGTGEKTGGSGGSAPSDPGLSAPKTVTAPWWLRVVPFFLSAFFFLSAIFAVFAPLPLLLLRFRSGRKWGWVAIATNATIVGFAAGGSSCSIYVVFVGVLALAMGELIAARRSLEKTAVFTFLSMLVIGGAVIGWYSHIHHAHPIAEFRQELSATVDYLQASVAQSNSVSPADAEVWKQNLMIEFPSAIAVFALILIWANLSLLLRVNPAGIRECMGLDAGFVRSWKAPEWLVWPTIAAGVFLIVDAGLASHVSVNVFRFLMAIYAIQGLSILSFFFDVWNVRGVFRVLAFLASILLMMPLLLSLGFFDLWFDFRSKFRQV